MLAMRTKTLLYVRDLPEWLRVLSRRGTDDTNGGPLSGHERERGVYVMAKTSFAAMNFDTLPEFTAETDILRLHLKPTPIIIAFSSPRTKSRLGGSRQ